MTERAHVLRLVSISQDSPEQLKQYGVCMFVWYCNVCGSLPAPPRPSGVVSFSSLLGGDNICTYLPPGVLGRI